MVARVVRKDGAVRVEKLTCVADCGIAVSPAGVDEQLYGGLMWAGHATSDRIDFRHGRVQQSNFDTYRVMRMSDMPDTDIHIVQGDPAKPGGVGELSAGGDAGDRERGIPADGEAVAGDAFRFVGGGVA